MTYKEIVEELVKISPFTAEENEEEFEVCFEDLYTVEIDGATHSVSKRIVDSFKKYLKK